MSGHWRFCVTAFLLSAGPSISPAFSNPLTDLFDPAPKEAAAPAPAPAREACALQPGKPASGQHWFYRLDGRRKCWYQADEATASAKRHIHHRIDRIAKRRAVAPEENEAELRDKTVLDARAQLLSAASAGGLLDESSNSISRNSLKSCCDPPRGRMRCIWTSLG